ncbi:hypothetical protein PPM_p0128 (plasmid) [Paenibacillus polymyxa M1]|uniref:hypothetical protein n=1 Tax=Paenibacillus polymyxa TaxID=1406 RepID=UPI00021BBB6C|nr:hypothetical protein [Paenibacillus polymyxa]CCC86278.1 hypothetical protein PPM_p0128 [Paenibacillus polymyxa M1]
MEVALVIESSNRTGIAPANQFYAGPKNRWVKSVLEYMKVIDFPTEHIYFLSFHEFRIIPYYALIQNYPISIAPEKKVQKQFAERIIVFLKTYYPTAEVHIHAGKSITNALVPLLKKEAISYSIFAEGKQLLKKSEYYNDLILQERAMKRMRDLKMEKAKIIAIPEYFTPQEAEHIVKEYAAVAHKYGVEKLFSEIRLLLRQYKQQLRHAQEVKDKFEQSINEEERRDLQRYWDNLRSLSDLFNSQMSEFHSKNGRLMASLTTLLIKQGYVKNTLNRISEAMFRLQIALIKS